MRIKHIVGRGVQIVAPADTEAAAAAKKLFDIIGKLNEHFENVTVLFTPYAPTDICAKEVPISADIESVIYIGCNAARQEWPDEVINARDDGLHAFLVELEDDAFKAEGPGTFDVDVDSFWGPSAAAGVSRMLKVIGINEESFIEKPKYEIRQIGSYKIGVVDAELVKVPGVHAVISKTHTSVIAIQDKTIDVAAMIVTIGGYQNEVPTIIKAGMADGMPVYRAYTKR